MSPGRVNVNDQRMIIGLEKVWLSIAYPLGAHTGQGV